MRAPRLRLSYDFMKRRTHIRARSSPARVSFFLVFSLSVSVSLSLSRSLFFLPLLSFFFFFFLFLPFFFFFPVPHRFWFRMQAGGFRVLAAREIYLKKICTSDPRDICVAAKPLRPKLRGLARARNPTTEIYIRSCLPLSLSLSLSLPSSLSLSLSRRLESLAEISSAAAAVAVAAAAAAAAAAIKH